MRSPPLGGAIFLKRNYTSISWYSGANTKRATLRAALKQLYKNAKRSTDRPPKRIAIENYRF